MSGIFSYIHTQAPHWTTVVTSFENSTLQVSGCIADLMHADEIARLTHDGVPVVAVDVDQKLLPKDGAPIVHVQVDNRAIAKFAAAHFAEIGTFRSYAYVHASGRPGWSIEREHWFCQKVSRRGSSYVVLPYPSSDSLGEFMRRLLALPKPIAVFCAHDRCAQNLLGVCKSAGLKIPGDVAIMGVDNDTFLCDYSDPSLSSVEPDFEREGFLAARELDRLLSNPKKNLRRTPPAPVKGIVIRSSTRPGCSFDILVQTGLDFIHNNFNKRISVTSVTRAMGVSRRLAELRFRQIKKTSIGETIIETRLKHVQRLLRTTKLSIAEIALDSGFTDASYMTRLFRKRTGQTPLAWARNQDHRTAS